MEAVGEIMQALAFWEWTDPTINRVFSRQIPGMPSMEVPVRFSYDEREGDFLDYNIRIHPYSMSHQSPQSRLQTVRTVWAQDVMPNAEAMASQGISPNFGGYLKIVANYSDMTELEELVVFSEPPPEAGPGVVGSPAGPRKGSNTTRTYERISRSGNTQQGKNQQMMQALASGNADKGMDNLFGGQ